MSDDKSILEMSVYVTLGIFAMKETSVFGAESELWVIHLHTHKCASFPFLHICFHFGSHFSILNYTNQECLLTYLEIQYVFNLQKILSHCLCPILKTVNLLIWMKYLQHYLQVHRWLNLFLSCSVFIFFCIRLLTHITKFVVCI